MKKTQSEEIQLQDGQVEAQTPEPTQAPADEKHHAHVPLVHLVKRPSIPWWHAYLIRLAAVLAALVVCSIVTVCLTKGNPIEIYKTMIDGNFGTERRIWKLLFSTAVLLGISLAVTPAFKMRFWNIGAEGQVLIGGLATAACMFYLGGKVSNELLMIIMLLAALVMGALWGFLPAICKAKWGTNETLFTLMMNYVAMQLIAFFILTWDKSGSGVVSPWMLKYGRLPVLMEQRYLLVILAVAVLTVFMFVYLRYSKHGYEISVVGESENTARYVGINVKWVILRTMILSGALCGLIGYLLVGGTEYSIATTTAGGRGFTAIMVSWLAKFNPLYMVLTAGLLVFFQSGGSEVASQYNLTAAFSEILTGIILFFIIGCEFFIQYQIKFRKKEVADQ